MATQPVPGDDTCLFVVAGSVSCQLQNLSSQVLEDCCQVHRGTSSNPASILHPSKQQLSEMCTSRANLRATWITYSASSVSMQAFRADTLDNKPSVKISLTFLAHKQRSRGLQRQKRDRRHFHTLPFFR